MISAERSQVKQTKDFVTTVIYAYVNMYIDKFDVAVTKY